MPLSRISLTNFVNANTMRCVAKSTKYSHSHVISIQILLQGLREETHRKSTKQRREATDIIKEILADLIAGKKPKYSQDIDSNVVRVFFLLEIS
jgi:hypothetical protein